MNLSRNDRPKRTPVLRGFYQLQAIDCMTSLLNAARAETAADALVKFSGHLERLASHIANEGFSTSEIVELLRQEAEQFAGQGESVKCM